MTCEVCYMGITSEEPSFSVWRGDKRVVCCSWCVELVKEEMTTPVVKGSPLLNRTLINAERGLTPADHRFLKSLNIRWD